MKTVLALLASTLLIVPALAQVDPEYLDTVKVVRTFKFGNAYRYVMPPKQVYYGAVEGVQVSPDSQYLAFLADPQANRKIPYFPGIDQLFGNEKAKPTLNICNVTTGKVISVLTALTPDTQIETYSWMAGSPYLSAIVNGRDQDILTLINPANGQLNDISLGNASSIFLEPLFIASTSLIIIPRVVMVNQAQQLRFQIIDIRSKQSRTITLKENPGYDFWSDGSQVYTCNRNWETGVKTTTGFVNLQTGEVTPVQPEPINAPLPAYWVLSFTQNITIQQPPENNSTSREYKATNQATLTREGLDGGSTPDGKIAWFTDRSGLNICDIAPVTAQQFEDMAKEIVMRDAVSRGKQIGTAMMIYASDYDDYFPPASDWQNNVAPYIKNNSMFDGFVYMLNGENSTTIENPAQRILGTIETPFGTATVYADTHTIWKDRPKPTK